MQIAFVEFLAVLDLLRKPGVTGRILLHSSTVQAVIQNRSYSCSISCFNYIELLCLIWFSREKASHSRININVGGC